MKALRINENEDCPSCDFEQGEPSGKCWGDGHYQCNNCIHYREDFKRLGQDFIDFCHMPMIKISTYENTNPIL
jgi:hypothetical protein